MPTKAVNNFTNGLNLSIDSINQPKDTYSYALNAIKEDAINNPEIITNERGFTTYIDLGYEYLLLGSIYLGKKNYIHFIKNIDSQSRFNRIILVEDTTITTVLDNIQLNFNTNNPIKGTYRINYKNERIIYWVDGLNKDRILNIDNNNITDIDQLSLDILYNPAILESKFVDDNNGNLKTGAYEFYASYKTEDNAVTPWFILNAKPIYIIQAATNNIAASQYINIDGCDSNLPTTKSIQLNLASLDTRFSKLRIGILKTINGNTSGYFLDNIPFSTDTKTYTYTGFDTEATVANIAEFTTDIVRYYGSNAIIQSNNRLVRANTNAVKIDIDYQALANNIVVDYYISEDKVLEMADSRDYNVRSDWWKSAATKYTDEQTLMRDEVYAVGVAFGLKKEGIETEVYHIPGRLIDSVPITSYESEFKDIPSVVGSSTWDSQIVTDNGDSLPRWKVQNTAAKSLDGNVHKLAYWESTDTYPSGFNFPVGSIRHHKMPSSNIEPIYRTEIVAGTINVYKRNLGLKFSNIQVPDSIKDNISYIRIYIAPRDIDQNKSIIAKGIFVNCAQTKIFSIGDQNHISTPNLYVVPVTPYNDLADVLNNGTYENHGPASDGTLMDNYYHSFYSPDTLLRNPTINSDRIYIENEISGVVQHYNTWNPVINIDPARPRSEHHLRSAADNGGYKRDLFYPPGGSDSGDFIPTKSSTLSSHDVYNVTKPKTTYRSICILNQINKVSSGKVTRKLKKSVYVPFNSQLTTDQLGGMDNPYYSLKGAANVLVELDTTKSTLGATELTDTSVQYIDNDIRANVYERTSDANSVTEGTFHFHTVQSPLAVYRYGSLKRTNTAQYGDILGLRYIPTDLVIASPTIDINNKITNTIQGLIGDSYIDLFSIKRVRYAAKKQYTFGGLPEINIGFSSFFTESQVNQRLRYAENVPPKTLYPKVLENFSIPEYTDYGNSPYIIDNDNYYKNNTDFDKVSSKQNFGVTQIDLDTKGVVNYPTRLVYSEKLLNETVADSYRVFLANNYLDLSKNTGFITNLFNKQQELYAITRDSLWRLFASNQTIKSTSTENITVGTGEFLSNEPVEILSIDGGYAGSSSKASLVETPYGYFYCDRYKGRFILFDGQQKDIALKGVNQFTENNFELELFNQISTLDKDFDSPLSNYGYLAGYEPENNRILITKLDYQFTPTTFTKYKGIYNPSTSYTVGDIYLKDGILYEYGSTTTGYITISQGDMSLFTPSNTDNIGISTNITTGPTHGTLVLDPTDNSQMIYTPNTDYVGSDSTTLQLNCSSVVVPITIQDNITVPDYTFSVAEKSSNGTLVGTVTASFGGSITYDIEDGNGLGIFGINSSSGLITVIDNTNLLYDTTTSVVLTVKATSGLLSANSTVTINITQVTAQPTHPNEVKTILNTTPIGTIVDIVAQASYPNPPSPYSSLIYTVTSESTPGAFIMDFSDPTAMTVTSNAIYDPAVTSTYTIGVNAYDNLDATYNVNFTITINILYDPNKLSCEPYTFSCVTSNLITSGYNYQPFTGGYTMKDAYPPQNSNGYTYAYKHTDTGHMIFSLFFLINIPSSASYTRNNFLDQIIGRLTNAAFYPSSNINLTGTSRGYTLGGYIDTNGYIHINRNDDGSMVGSSDLTDNRNVIRLFNLDYASEFTDTPPRVV